MSSKPADPLERILGAIPPASGALVMGTGIVSIGLSIDGHETLSRILLVIDGVAWLTLGTLLGARLLRDRARVEQEGRSPAALTGVAGTAVLGTRLTLLGWDWAGIALLVIALVLWLTLLGPVLTHWLVPTIGVSLVLTVSTESLAVLSATLAVGEHADWLLDAALVPFAIGLAFYVFAISASISASSPSATATTGSPEARWPLPRSLPARSRSAPKACTRSRGSSWR